MKRRYLFGPVTAAFADQNLHRARQTGECWIFGTDGGADLITSPRESWETICRRLPAGWQPDLVVLYLPYTTIPAGLWSAPVPLVGLAADWNLLWHAYRRRLPCCDLVLTDTAGVEVMTRAGMSHARAANLFGCERAFLEPAQADAPRDIDVLFVGNVHPAVQRERLPWLARLARLSEYRKVVIQAGVFGEAYRRLLSRARIVFNRSIRGEANKRAFEAAAAGALLFQEDGNREVPTYFRPGRECVYYNDDNLEALLDRYLDHEDERRALAEAARRRVQEFSFSDLWPRALDQVERDWPALTGRSRRRHHLAVREELQTRTWEALATGPKSASTVVQDLAAALVERPTDADLHNALGVAQAMTTPDPAQAVGYFQRALTNQPDHLVAGLNLVEALALSKQSTEAITVAQRLLAITRQPGEVSPHMWDSAHFPPAFDDFRVEWEKAAWSHAGRPRDEGRAKTALVRWRLHHLLGELTSQVNHYYEATLGQPELALSRRALGAVLRQTGQYAEAAAQLATALTANPFDLEAARLLFQALGEAGDGLGQRRLARERRQLCRAAPELVPLEQWFFSIPPPGDELVSIVILCCNQFSYTRLCIDSVLQHSRRPYELVLVDNASSDGTREYLAELRQYAGTPGGPERVEIIQNETNRGYPVGCNQGIAASHGRYIVFLNNDTVVTAGWLEGLIRCAIHDWPNVGLVGPLTNNAAAPQAVRVDYVDLAGLPAFAARFRAANAGQAEPVERLIGFCLLARREVLDAIGGFDEQFGIGTFDDDDLGFRAQERGFQLLIAREVFIHHFGSRTFRGLGVDMEKQLRANLELFRAKWGDERAGRYQVPPPAVPGPKSQVQGPKPSSTLNLGLSTLDLGPQTVSLCMIVKNEEANLGACLESVRGLFHQMVIVDTGSTDRTPDIAREFGALVVYFPWVDSFAAARNEALRHATGGWIFWLDADDRVDAANRDKLARLFTGLRPEMASYSMKCRCVGGALRNDDTDVDHVRLFPNHPSVRWTFRVHEQILPALGALGAAKRFVDVVIHHVGYCDPALRRRKLERDLRLLRLEEKENPDHAFVLFNIACSCQELGDFAEALVYARRSLEHSHPADSIVRKLYAVMTNSLQHLGRSDEALATCRAGRAYYPDDQELLFLEGVQHQQRGEDADAERCYQRLLTTREGAHFASVSTALRGYKTRQNLAVLYMGQKRLAEAEAQWRTSLRESPDYVPAWIGLGDVFLAAGRWAEAEEAAAWLASRPEGAVPAVLIRARAAGARQDYGTARVILEQALESYPGEARLWLWLGRVLHDQGHEHPTFARAYQEALRLEPHNASIAVELAQLASMADRGSAARVTDLSPTRKRLI